METKKQERVTERASFGILGAFILILGVLAFPALSAFSSLPGNNAGQGFEVVDGFIVNNVGYDAKPSSNDPDAVIVEVNFFIEREGAERDPVNFTNAGVFVQLRSDDYISEWAKCLVVDGYAECFLEAQAQMEVVDITGISVVAYDSEADNVPFIATGGDLVYDITINQITYRVHEFQTVGSSTFAVESVSIVPRVEYIIVGGGGSGGGGWAGGGGGAGGLLQGSTFVTPGTYTVSVGGAGAASTGTGNAGGSSSAFGQTALGGGGAGGGGGNGAGRPGGSGGGGGWQTFLDNADRSGGLGTPGQGNDGGIGRSQAAASRGGGGGGAGSIGSNYGATSAGNGGSGFTTNITGSTRCLAGGGGGGAESSSHTRGSASCGGGAGGQANNSSAVGAAPNTGGGGGGGAGSLNAQSGAGGSGTVILRYRIN